jgi:hypothetical protein
MNFFDENLLEKYNLEDQAVVGRAVLRVTLTFN